MTGIHKALTTAARRELHAVELLRDTVVDHLGLGLSEAIALGHIYDDGPLTASELGQRLRLTSGSVTALLNRLESVEYTERLENPADGRSVLIGLRPTGAQAWEWAEAQFLAPILRAVRGSDVSVRQAIDLFEAIAAQMTKTATELG
jgi:DNA-binding MarR family transcriptional regulator